MCNKLASRHVRVRLADPSDIARCDICENAPAFFYCEIDGSSLCLQCDMLVHVGGKRTHERYLIFRQRVEFPGDKPGQLEDPMVQPLALGQIRKEQNHSRKVPTRENLQNQRVSSVLMLAANNGANGKMDTKLIDLNTRPNRMHGQTSNNQEMDYLNGSNGETASIVPIGSSEKETER
ncbi:hypothetical protein GIB67_019493 [Kingdonia uniflora]|uniref:B box-type domain-containing protein n=1 Tax=Kingdonia uniflora TaxID=39325 RepID=A0A7J7N090_9MAGN|nr:hypothetical protein GIB67_019493 [Kingdonia uniflora]